MTSVRLDNLNPMSNADVLLTIVGVPGYWSEFSGIKKTYNRPMYSDGLSNMKRMAASGSIEYEEVTIAKAHDPERDDPILDWLRSVETGVSFDMTIRPVMRTNGMTYRGNKAWALSGCKITSWSILENTDTADGEEVTKISVTFRHEDAVWGGSKSPKPPIQL